MRRLIVSTFVSADGVMEAPENWCVQFWSEDIGKYKLDEIMASDALLLGRFTYDELAAAWPTMTDPDGFADRMNSIPKYVVSSTLTDLPWNNSHRIDGDIEAQIKKLKAEPGQDILLIASAALMNALLQRDLVEEFRLMTFPVFAGTGKHLFSSGNPQKQLELADGSVLPHGVTLLTYRPTDNTLNGKLPYGWE